MRVKHMLDSKGQQHGERRARDRIHQYRFQCVNFVIKTRHFQTLLGTWELGSPIMLFELMSDS